MQIHVTYEKERKKYMKINKIRPFVNKKSGFSKADFCSDVEEIEIEQNYFFLIAAASYNEPFS